MKIEEDASSHSRVEQTNIQIQRKISKPTAPVWEFIGVRGIVHRISNCDYVKV